MLRIFWLAERKWPWVQISWRRRKSIPSRWYSDKCATTTCPFLWTAWTRQEAGRFEQEYFILDEAFSKFGANSFAYWSQTSTRVGTENYNGITTSYMFDRVVQGPIMTAFMFLSQSLCPVLELFIYARFALQVLIFTFTVDIYSRFVLRNYWVLSDNKLQVQKQQLAVALVLYLDRLHHLMLILGYQYPKD